MNDVFKRVFWIYLSIRSNCFGFFGLLALSEFTKPVCYVVQLGHLRSQLSFPVIIYIIKFDKVLWEN